jgi:hypothetical protein
MALICAPLPLSERKRDLRRLCRKSPVPFMREVKPSRSVLCYSITAASLISRAWFRSAWRRDIRAGPSRNWIKTKCPGWKRINSERYL